MLKKVDKLKTVVKGVKVQMGKLEDMIEAIMRAHNIQMNTDEGVYTSR